MIDDLFCAEMPRFGSQQYPSKKTECGHGYIIHVPHGCLMYFPQFIEKKIADRTLSYFFENENFNWQKTDWHAIKDIHQLPWKNIAWQQDSVKLYGKTHELPRISAWYGDTGKDYKYSGLLLHPKPWNPALLWMKKQIESVCNTPFNSVLLNWYRSGLDHISWHTDAEPELGKNPTIASLNFGEQRRFLLRRNDDHSDKIEIVLGHADLLVMQGELQHHWQHSVPKQTKISKGRLNMTFRHILSE